MDKTRSLNKLTFNKQWSIIPLILYFACVFLLTAAGFGMVAISLNDFPALLLKCCICEKLQIPPSGRESFLLSLLTSLILAIFAKRTAKEVLKVLFFIKFVKLYFSLSPISIVWF